MQDLDPHRALLRAVNSARPDDVAAVIAEVLNDYWGATKVHVLLANDQLSGLRPLGARGKPVWLGHSAAAEAFTAQEAVLTPTDTSEMWVHLPVTVGGERLGVLEVVLPSRCPDEQLDQLADLATLIGYALHATRGQTDLLHRAVRTQRMTLAAELQWQLLPPQGRTAPEYELVGHLEPAYSAYADAFDWAENEDMLLVGIFDATTDARSTPLLTTLAVTAARNARRAGLDIAGQASMADQAIYSHHRGAHSVDALLMSVDTSTGQVSVVRAGSPELVLIRDRVPQTIELVDQIPLGMFERTDYATQSFDLAAGDRLVLMSDGVGKALAGPDDACSQDALREILDTTIDTHPARVVRTLIHALTHAHGRALTDDATVLCLDWTGPGREGNFSVSAPDTRVPDARPRLSVVPTRA